MYENIEQIIQDPAWISLINEESFELFALAVFRFQYTHNEIYRKYAETIGCAPDAVHRLSDIPFLPISFFKTHKVQSVTAAAELIFESSGTTGSLNSKHFVFRAEDYRASFLHHFRHFYGTPGKYVFLCLLPSYLERQHSSLVYMAEELIRRSGAPESGFYLNEWEQLAGTLQQVRRGNKQVILLGVTFALLDFAERFPMDLSSVIVMETGGMKGRREEWTRAQIHDFLKEQWRLPAVHSEYGMTELFSQAYSLNQGIFRSTPPMKVCIRAEDDPLSFSLTGSGCLNIMDLANVRSCAFIATEDIARIHADGSFEVIGRMDHSALRGCSLMAV